MNQLFVADGVVTEEDDPVFREWKRRLELCDPEANRAMAGAASAQNPLNGPGPVLENDAYAHDNGSACDPAVWATSSTGACFHARKECSPGPSRNASSCTQTKAIVS